MRNYITLRGLQKKLSYWWQHFPDLKHYLHFQYLSLGKSATYKEYLSTQFQTTLVKRHRQLPFHIKLLIDLLILLGNPAKNCRILCVGPRNEVEISYFHERGFPNVIGIDLVSQNPDVQIMDMHNMTFSDNSFQIIYSSHSLEHSYNIEQVIAHIVRVAVPGALIAIEVPIKYSTNTIDRIDFGNVKNIHAQFGGYVGKVLWQEEQPPRCSRNDQGTAIARTVFTINK